jgi:5-methylcytosine-specific restriction protein B
VQALHMEGSMRGVEFYLPSGRRAMIPKNLIFIATMNPEDRSVDEIDAAMERRWAKVALKPDANKLREFLVKNGAPSAMLGPVIDFFNSLQKHIAIGHAFFRMVKDPASLARVWNNQLRYVVWKAFRFDAETRQEIESLWGACEQECNAILPPEAGALGAEKGAAA